MSQQAANTTTSSLYPSINRILDEDPLLSEEDDFIKEQRKKEKTKAKVASETTSASNESKPILQHTTTTPPPSRFDESSYRTAIKSWAVDMWETTKKNKSIFLWVIGAILANVAQSVYLKQSGNKMPAFPYFLFWWTVIPFVIVFYLLLAGAWLMGSITPEMRRVPQYKFMIIGTLTTLNGVLMLFANPHVPGVMQALLGPTVVTIPLSMFFSFILLKRRYSWKQILAVCVILGGLFVALYPSIFQGKQQAGNIGWDFAFLGGSIPLTLAFVYQEKQFEETPIHITYMLAWSTLYQAITIFMCLPLDGIPEFGTSSFHDLFTHQWQGIRCFFRLSIPHDVCPDCDCDTAWIAFLLFTIAYIVTNFTSLGVIKYGNATFLFIVTTLSLPLTEFAFAMRWLMGDDVESVSPFNYGALAVLLIGVILYRIFDTTAHKASIEAVPELKVIDTPEGVTLVHDEDSGNWARALTVSSVSSYATVQPEVYMKKGKRKIEMVDRKSVV